MGRAEAGTETKTESGMVGKAGTETKTESDMVGKAGAETETGTEGKAENRLDLKGNPEDYCSTTVNSEPGKRNTVVAITSDKMGSGDDELGTKLMISFFRTIVLLEPAPASLVFYNSGVKLALDDSPVLDHIKELIEKGSGVYLCTTCISHFGIKDRLPVGSFSDMYQILNLLKDADHIIRP
jgi:selenium metabolism protein YedF